MTDATGSSGIDTVSSSTSGGLPTTTLPEFETIDSNPEGTNKTTGIETTSTSSPVDPTTSTSTTDVDPTTSTGDDTTTTGGEESSTTGCDTDDGPLCEIPPEEMEPTPKPDGLPSPIPGVYDDLGEADPNAGVRALIGLPTRNRPALEQLVEDMYDPANPSYGQYMTVAEWMADHAPPQADFDVVKAWLELRGMQVNFEASNRMVIQFSGSVADFNDTFDTTLHVCLRKNPQAGNPPFEVYCTVESFTVPIFIADRTLGLLTADLPAATGNLPGEAGAVVDDPPGDFAFDPNTIAQAYEIDDLLSMGFTGQGQKIGVIGAAHYHAKDLQTFWKSFDITRQLPTPVELMEKVVTRITETILDTQWSSSSAPGADVIVYEGPDARNTSLVYVFNEAIARGEVDVITNSFAHREDSEPKPVRDMYDHSALMAAALGITVVSASGDSARPDTPCTSPYVTCVGGTRLVTGINGQVISETAWEESGSGENKSFAVPYWQEEVAPGTKRALCDVALNADPGTGYWVRRFGNWEIYGGTSFSSPVFAGLIAVVNSYRVDQGLPRVGFLNPILYQDAAVRASFRDITQGGTDLFDAEVGWDMPTGWGAPRAKKLADAIP